MDIYGKHIDQLGAGLMDMLWLIMLEPSIEYERMKLFLRTIDEFTPGNHRFSKQSITFFVHHVLFPDIVRGKMNQKRIGTLSSLDFLIGSRQREVAMDKSMPVEI